MSDDVIVHGFFCVIALVFFLIFYGAWRAFTPKGFFLYLIMWGCAALAVVGFVHSTLPSSAPRRQVVGTISWITDHREGKWDTYTLGFKTDQGVDLKFTAAATPLFFAKGRDKVALTYLDEKTGSHYPRAIRFRALTGPRSGDETAVSADWFGPSLGVGLSAIIGIAALFGAINNKRISTKSSAG